MGSLSQLKAELRQKYKVQRAQMDKTIKADFDRQIGLRVQKIIGESSSIWTTYSPIHDEVDLHHVMENLSHIHWAYPVIQNDEMKFFIPSSPFSMKPSRLGFLEPNITTSREASVEDINGCLVPGLAFDRRGNRLGFGKGYYDKFLKNFKGRSVGVAYDFQVTETELPAEANDVAVECIVTEKEVIMTSPC